MLSNFGADEMKRSVGFGSNQFCNCIIWIVVIDGGGSNQLVLHKDRRRHRTMTENVDTYPNQIVAIPLGEVRD